MSVKDPGLFALEGGIRLALVLPAAFAFALVVLDLPQAALFAAFGSVAMIVFVEFGGSRRDRLRAYALLGLAGAPLIALGTLCSRSTVAAVAAMAVIGFAILFAGVANGYLAAGQTAAILAFVLAVMVPAGTGDIPARLLGWGLATALSTAAILLLWPRRPRDSAREAIARAARALAGLIEAGGQEGAEREALSRSSLAEIRAARRRFLSFQHRPSGTGGRTAALAGLLEDLGWLHATAARPVPPPPADGGLGVDRATTERLVPGALRDAAGCLEGGPTDPLRADVAALERAHRETGEALLARLAEARPGRDEAVARELIEESFRLRTLAFGSSEVGTQALRAVGERAADPDAGPWERLRPAGKVMRAHSHLDSVWLRNSLRGAAGLAVAVLVGQLAGVQNSFWVVLGTLSVLRSDALGTGATVAEAVVGTLAGIVVGGLLVIAVDGSEAAMWAVLPPACLLAAYAPRAISFVAGQAAFSVLVLILFNLLDTGGWEVGLVRFVDVLIGSAVALMAGLLLWPRGAITDLRDDLGAAYRDATELLRATAERLLGRGPDPAPAARRAFESAQVLEASARDCLQQRGSARHPLGDLATLGGGVTRLRHVAALLGSAGALARPGPVGAGSGTLREAADAFEANLRDRCEWYGELAAALAERGPVPAPEGAAASRRPHPGPIALDRPGGDGGGFPPGLGMAWGTLHLEALLPYEPALAEAAGRVLGDPRPGET